MFKTIDITNIQNKLCNSLKESGWYNILKTFILSDDFSSIIKQLYEETLEGKRFTPVISEIFTAFRECPYRDLHTIFITREPYNMVNVANGIAFDCSNSQREHFATTALLDAVQRTIYKEEAYDRPTGLKSWSNQGILLLNANLTAQIGKPLSHTKIWDPFTAFLLDTLNTINKGLIFVFIGEDVKPLGKLMDNRTHYKYTLKYPQINKRWDSENIFPVISKLVLNNYNYKIKW